MSELKPAKYFIQKISQNYNVAMFKPGCPFCSASKKLIEALEETQAATPFSIYTVDIDFTNETLVEVSTYFGWKPDGIQPFPSKPQIFIEGKYVGGNREFYASNWNNNEGMPKLTNPMRF